MKKYLSAKLAALILLTLSASLFAQYDRSDRVTFENRSSDRLLVYRAPINANTRPVRQLSPGETFVAATGRDQLWLVSTPVWYRIVGSIRLSDGAWNRRLTIRNSDVEAVGRREVSTTFNNRSRVPIKVNMLVEGKELDWLWIGAQGRASTSSFEGQQWVVRTQAGGRFLQRASTPRSSTTVTIEGRGFGGGGGQFRPPPIGYPPPVVNDKVRVKFVNDSSQPVYIYKMKDGAWKYTKRIYAGRELSLEFEAGQHISLRHPWSGDEIERFRAPSRDATHRIGRGGREPDRPRRR